MTTDTSRPGHIPPGRRAVPTLTGLPQDQASAVLALNPIQDPYWHNLTHQMLTDLLTTWNAAHAKAPQQVPAPNVPDLTVLLIHSALMGLPRAAVHLTAQVAEDADLTEHVAALTDHSVDYARVALSLGAGLTSHLLATR